MKKNLLAARSRLNELKSNEEGMTIVEVVVAITVIAFILVLSGLALVTVVNTAVATDSQNRAYSIITDVFALAKQSSFDKLSLPLNTTGDNSACPAVATSASSHPDTSEEALVIGASANSSFSGIEYCNELVGGVPGSSSQGIKYTVRTDITWATSANYGSSTSSANSNKYPSKRITVTVTWNESTDGGNTVSTQKVSRSFVRVATPAECIPPDLQRSTLKTPPGCVM